VPKENILNALSSQMHEFYTVANAIRGDKALTPYADGKWTLKEMIGHMIETERVFAYRALSISRGDKTELPGMDQDKWMKDSNYNSRSVANLCNEYLAVRTSTIHLFQNMTKEMINASGIASGVEFSVRALAFIIVGHELHHLEIIRENYMKDKN
jgi:hypothetical protein